MSELPRATVLDTLAFAADVLGPALGKGDIIRRPRVVELAARLDLDRRAVRRHQRLRDRYGPGPLLLRIPGRSQAVILAPEHVHRVLDESPEPFATDSSEKRASLSHFEPRGVLISRGPERADRRRFNEEVLDTPHPMHRLAERFGAVVEEEAAALRGELDWTAFSGAWFRVVRRIVFGDAAREDHEVTNLVARLRGDANWAFLKPKRDRLRERFFARMESHLARAEPGSLANVMAHTRTTSLTAPTDQVPQWLFGFDPACMAAFRALALIASHPEARADDAGSLRACVLESLRLWPTTPLVLRQTTGETQWENGTMPAGTGVLIYSPFFHRDDTRLAYADRFAPEVWADDRAHDGWPLIPFSSGPAVCPGRNLVLMLTTLMISAILRGRTLVPAQRLTTPLPATLSPYSLRFRLEHTEARR